MCASLSKYFIPRVLAKWGYKIEEGGDDMEDRRGAALLSATLRRMRLVTYASKAYK